MLGWNTMEVTSQTIQTRHVYAITPTPQAPSEVSRLVCLVWIISAIKSSHNLLKW
jgi:hypothetical protein